MFPKSIFRQQNLTKIPAGKTGQSIDERDDDALHVDLGMELAASDQEAVQRGQVQVVREDLKRKRKNSRTVSADKNFGFVLG